MKKRYIYTLLFLVPGLFVALLITFTLFAVAYGALWLFVFGDNTWPDWTEQVMPALMLVIFSSIWIGTIVTGYCSGKKFETSPGFDVRHLWLSLGATLLPIVIMLLHQFSIGNLGPKSDGQLCSEYCSGLGYDMSSISPQDYGEQTCSCIGPKGEDEVTILIDDLRD